MASEWVVLSAARVLENTKTGQLGIQCSCGGEVIPVGNQWRDVTEDFTWHEKVVPLSYACVAGNNVLHMTAQITLAETVSEEIHVFETTKWHSMVDSAFPIMVVHTDGTVTMLDGQHWPAGYVTADFTGVSTDDNIYINLVVPVQ